MNNNLKNSNQNDQNNKNSNFFNQNPIIVFLIFAVLIIAVFRSMSPDIGMDGSKTTKNIPYSELKSLIVNKQISKVYIGQSTIKADGGNVLYTAKKVQDPNLTTTLDENEIPYGAFNESNVLTDILFTWVIPIFIFFGIWMFLVSRMQKNVGGGILGIGSSKKLVNSEKPKVKFDDVAGVEEAKEEVQEIVDYLKSPDKYLRLGAKIPKGILLVGPPGTGKTLLARAVAGEADVPFFSISASSFIEMFVGVGASRVRDLFENAKKEAPSIVFIDEIDAIGKSRSSAPMGGNDEREQTLNQLLSEMDGFDGNIGIVMLAATNRPEILDPALLRPGRFDRQIRVELPTLKDRIEILKVHAKKYLMEDGIDFSLVARSTAGASGAQLANILNEAALRAVRMGHDKVRQEDIQESIEVVIAGAQRKQDILSPEEKKRVSYHEIGHALVAALQTGSEPVEKITIIPRTSGALGYTMQVPKDEKNLYTREDLINHITTLCGGRAAEEVIFNEVSTGAANDIEKATETARAMITQYGMADEFGMVKFQDSGSRYMGDNGNMNCSEETRKEIDDLMVKIVKNAQENARKLIADNRDAMKELAEYLLEEETITGKQFMEILSKYKNFDEENKLIEK